MDPQETRNDIEKALGSIPGFFSGIPQDTLVQMWSVMKPYIFGQTKIPAKYREMISFAVAVALKCPQCETFHAAASKMNGATEEDLAEIRTIIGQVTFWSTAQHALSYDMNALMKEFQAMGEKFKQHQTDSKT